MIGPLLWRKHSYWVIKDKEFTQLNPRYSKEIPGKDKNRGKNPAHILKLVCIVMHRWVEVIQLGMYNHLILAKHSDCCLWQTSHIRDKIFYQVGSFMNLWTCKGSLLNKLNSLKWFNKAQWILRIRCQGSLASVKEGIVSQKIHISEENTRKKLRAAAVQSCSFKRTSIGKNSAWYSGTKGTNGHECKPVHVCIMSWKLVSHKKKVLAGTGTMLTYGIVRF